MGGPSVPEDFNVSRAHEMCQEAERAAAVQKPPGAGCQG